MTQAKLDSNLNIDELLTWPPAADPWHRQSSAEFDCVIVVEFSEVEGPKPLVIYPSSPGVHFDANGLAVWLMTCDYQQGSCSAAEKSHFSLSKCTQTLMHNEEQGLHAFVQHWILFDIEARGFVRPLCAAYVTRVGTKLPMLCKQIQHALNALVESLISCNRRQFLKELSQTIDALDSVDHRAISSYYELYYDSSLLGGRNGSSSGASRLEAISLRARKLYGELDSAYKCVSAEVVSHMLESSCQVHNVDISAWLAKLSQTTATATTTATTSTAPTDSGSQGLRAVSSLAPCVYASFLDGIEKLWSKFRLFDPSLRFLTDQSTGHSPFTFSGPSLHFGGYPLLHLPHIKRVKSSLLSAGRPETLEADFSAIIDDDDDEEGVDDARSLNRLVADVATNRRVDEANGKLLTTVVGSLSQLLFPLLTGQFMLVCAGDLRKPTGVDVLRKLRWFVPSAPNGRADPVRWHDGRVPPTAYADHKLYGQRVPQNMSVDDFVANNVRPFLSVLDLNGNVFHSSQYRGRLLDRLSRKRSSTFDTDRSLIFYIFSLIGDSCLLAYVLYYFMYSDQEMYRRSVLQMSRFSQMFSLEPGDVKILRYFVELLRQQDGDIPRVEGSFESLFLDHEPASRPLKL
uniref:UDENN FLCN/SMCR8-type domain-containing protein n=1 Tax=Plectus sambesii TaxID=2011161 RepID=A0A914V3I4_9BILA